MEQKRKSRFRLVFLDMAFFYSRKNKQTPLQKDQVDLVRPRDTNTLYFIEFVLRDGSVTEWAYLLRTDRDADLATIQTDLDGE